MTNYRVFSLLALHEQNWEKLNFIECLQLLLAFGPERYGLARRFVNCNKLNQLSVALTLAENYVKNLIEQLLTSDKAKQLSETEFLEYTSICTVCFNHIFVDSIFRTLKTLESDYLMMSIRLSCNLLLETQCYY
jgi:hypothetical protein